jgi:hypothetical protein
MDLHWRWSDLTSCLHACRALLDSQPFEDPDLAKAIQESAVGVSCALAQAGVDGPVFWEHVIPLSGINTSLRFVVSVSLIKTMGQAKGEVELPEVHAAMTELWNTWKRKHGRPADVLPSLTAIQRSWNTIGRRVVHRIGELLEPGVLVEEATVIGLLPLLGGHGSAYLPYNAVTVEILNSDSKTDFREALRLCWLLVQLNLDLPAFSEAIHRERLPRAAACAMIPVVKTAANDLKIEGLTSAQLDKAVESWLPAPPNQELPACLAEWWDSYRLDHPNFAVALQALDRMLN